MWQFSKKKKICQSTTSTVCSGPVHTHNHTNVYKHNPPNQHANPTPGPQPTGLHPPPFFVFIPSDAPSPTSIPTRVLVCHFCTQMCLQFIFGEQKIYIYIYVCVCVCVCVCVYICYQKQHTAKKEFTLGKYKTRWFHIPQKDFLDKQLTSVQCMNAQTDTW